MYIKSIQATIRQTIEDANKQLKQIEGYQRNPGNNSETQREVEAVLITQSLMDYLDER